jgi:tetratricopeptide (TPR) repeat protein
VPNTKENTLSVMLFNKESEWQAYTVEFLNKAREELQKQQEKIQLEAKKSAKPDPSLSPEALDKFKEKKETLIRLNDRIQEQTRLSFEAQEAMKREELLKQQEAKSKEEKEKAKNLAAEKAKQAFAAYQKGKFDDAVKLYEEASSLDPENDVFYYQYGVSLYKVNNFNKSLSILSMAEGGDQNPIEHRYYVALNHLKLNEIDKAVSEFKEIKDEDDKSLSPISAFYAGNIELKQNKFKEAREDFQFVLDKSSDPQLDKEAEAKIEEIDRLEQFYESQKEIYKYVLFVGPQYDGNVLNVATQNLATNSEAIRLQYGVSFQVLIHTVHIA